MLSYPNYILIRYLSVSQTMTDAQKVTEAYPVVKSGETRKNSSRNRQEQMLSPTAKH